MPFTLRNAAYLLMKISNLCVENPVAPYEDARDTRSIHGILTLANASIPSAFLSALMTQSDRRTRFTHFDRYCTRPFGLPVLRTVRQGSLVHVFCLDIDKFLSKSKAAFQNVIELC